MHYDFEYQEWKKAPASTLILQHIYGVQTSDRRNTVMYVHFQASVDLNQNKSSQQLSASEALGLGGNASAKLDLILPKILGQNYQSLINTNITISYDLKHQICQKFLVYFISRFAIIYNTQKNDQVFYQGHSLKISCLSRHPSRAIMATGEVNLFPCIHIWDANNLETLVVLKTSHRGGVLHLAFSSDGSLLLSIGMDKFFSLQIFQWEQNRTIAYRNVGQYPIFGVKFNPYNNQQFVTCGYEHMAIWKIKGTHLTCTSFQKLGAAGLESKPLSTDDQTTSVTRSILLCAEYISYKLGHSIQSDIIFGSNQGEISTYTSGKHFVLHETAHVGPINCIKATDILSDRVNIITGGEDGFIKVWDASFQLIQVVDVKAAQVLTDLKNKRAFAIQSLDVYACDRKNNKRVLVGLRCGEVMEAVVTTDTIPINQDSKKPSNVLMDNKKRPTMSFNFYTYLSSHSSLNLSSNQKKVFIAMYPLHSILASVGDDETLRMWDVNKHQIIVQKNLGSQATSLAFSPDGSFLSIGLINGIFLLLDSKVEKLNFGTYMEDFQPPSLEVIMSPKEGKSAILAMKFSYKGDYLAVSYDNETVNQDPSLVNKAGLANQKLQVEKKESSYVLLFVNRLSGKNPGIKLTSKDPYVRMHRIVLPLAEFHTSAQLRTELAVTQLDFSDDDCFIEMTSQKVNGEHIRDYSEGEDIFVIWDISQNQIVSDYDLLKKSEWPGWSLSNAINARYQGNQIFPENKEEDKKLRLIEQCTMAAVSRFSKIDNGVCGSVQGDLYLFRFGALYVDKNNVLDFNTEGIKKIDMSLTRGYSAHTSMVQNIEIHEDKYAFSTALSDQCIIQWQVEFEDQDWEMDFNKFNTEKLDPFSEIPSQEKFKIMMNEIWNHRLEVADINQNINQDEIQDPASELVLETVIGRRAFDRRNNVKIDCLDRIIYNAGSLIIFLQDNDDVDAQAIVKQTFLRPEDQKFTTISPGISTFALSEDKRILVIGTQQIEASIIVWEISTNLQLARLILSNCSIVNYLKIAHDNKHIIIIGLTKDYIQVIMIMDYITQNVSIFRQIIHSLPFKIKDVVFYPKSTRRFVTCGIQHMCFWQQSGRNLESQIGELVIPKSFTNLGGGVYSHDINMQNKFGLSLVCDDIDPFQLKVKSQEQDLENIYVTFLSIQFIIIDYVIGMGFLGQTLIASGDDGFLYLWENERIVRRVFAHEGSVFALDTNSKVGLIASGGMDGTVVLWRLLVETKANIKSLDKLKTISLAKHVDPQQAVLNPDLNVQSVCLGYNRIIIGTRSGSIYEVSISDDQKLIKPALGDRSQPKKWIKCVDQETPKSIAIDMISSRIFFLTQKGLFSVWDLQTFDVIYTKNFHKSSKALYSFKLSNKVMLVFDNEIVVLNSDSSINSFEELQPFNLKLNTISDAKLNYNEKILGVATTSAQSPEVTLYEVDGAFNKIKTLFGFKSSIKYIDFSTDNYYLQCEDNLGEVFLFEIETQRVIHTDAIDFELEWLGEGLRSYSQLKGIHYWYGANNKITQISKVVGKPIIVIGDELGTIRMFNYPNVQGEGYYQCYSDHLFVITQCLFSPDRKYFVSTSEMDRCIFKWKVIYNEEKIKKLMGE